MKQNIAQNVIEFAFVFIVIMTIFLAIIELALFWRAQYCVQNIAAEITANIQITAQNTKTEAAVVNRAVQILKARSGLLNLSSSGFNQSGSDGSYIVASTFQRGSAPALSAYININNLEKCDITSGIVYNYKGIFLYQNGRAISSGPSQSVQKF